MNSWERTYRALSAASKRRKDNPLFFRGHANSAWPLVPTLGRVNWTFPTAEQNSFAQFVTRAGDLLTRDATAWEIAFAMQHYGLPTRLLDWTETMGVALYFALRGARRPHNCAVWILKPFELNGHAIGRRALPHPNDIGDYGTFFIDQTTPFKPEAVAINPLRHNPRVFRQRSGFTLHGNLSRPLDELCPTAVTKIELPPTAWAGAREFLEHAGISEFSLFPELDALAREVREVYFA